MRHLGMILALGALAATARAQVDSIVNSRHNLSAAGPGAIHALTEQQICIFCHTPHNSAPIQPLWNRNVPTSAYSVYSSPSLKAVPGQPTGSSKLCLSCHDGTIAVGSVLSRGQSIAMAGGVTTVPPGASNLGTDLRDDHPISFRYDQPLLVRNPKLASPQSLPPAIHLDARQEMQCTSCHDAHNNRFGKFLVMDNSSSQLCSSCHRQGTTSITWHSQCNSCHKPHTAPSGPHLLQGKSVTDTCIACHNGQSGISQGPNIAADLRKFSRHDTSSLAGQRDQLASHVTCKDCHEPHTMIAGSATAPRISGSLGAVSGVNASGAVISRAQFQYETCFKCHGTQSAVQPVVSRQIAQNNTILEFATAAVSYHPVVAAGKNLDVPSLRPGLTTASIISCTDCHASDTSKAAGGSGPNGPHGSNYRPLLVAQYITADNTSESSATYALCYRCHDRSSILSDRSFPQHKRHIVDARTPCSVCHDAHGISSAQGSATRNSNLINFNIAVVKPADGRLEFNDTGLHRGRCYLTCHGVKHAPKSY